MDKIFSEIKKAIEEEMRNAESGPPPGGSRPSGGGRRAQEYADWLKEEQDRLRGDQSVQPIEGHSISAEDNWERQARDREQASQQRHQERRQQRSEQRSGSQSRSQRSEPQRQPRQQTQQTRAERRQTQRTASAYDQRRPGAAARRRVQRLLSTNQGLRQAFLIREIVSKPVSLRDKDDHLIS